MSRVKQVLSRVAKLMSKKSSVSSKGLTPDEVELMSYRRRAYLERVKQQLHGYRKQYSMLANEDWDRKFGEKKASILGQEASLLKARNTLTGNNNILGRGNNLLW